MRAFGLLLATAVSSGCFLPMTTAAPQTASTLGKGNFGATAYAEFPSVNLTATAARGNDPVQQGSNEIIAPSLTGVAQFSYGLTDSLDLEFGAEGMLYLFILPLPTGLHAGARYQLLETDSWRVATAARLGFSTFSTTTDGRANRINAFHGMGSAVVQWVRLPVFHPSLSVSLFPANVRFDATGVGVGNMWTLAGSSALNLTLDFGLVEISPYLGMVAFTSPNLAQPRLLPQFGIAFAVRGGKTAQGPNDQARARERPPASDPDEWAPLPPPAEEAPAEQPPAPL